MIAHQAAGEADQFGDAFSTFWFGEGSWAQMSREAQQKLLYQLQGLGLQCMQLLHEGYAESTARFLREAEFRKHYVHGTVATNHMVTRLAATLAEEAGFITTATPTSWGAGHMGPVTHAADVLPMLAECAMLAPSRADGVS